MGHEKKRRIDTREVYKWKARLNVHGGRQEYGEHYTETYAPVIGWSTIRLFLIMSIMFGWHTRQIDFVCARTIDFEINHSQQTRSANVVPANVVQCRSVSFNPTLIHARLIAQKARYAPGPRSN